MGILKTLEIRGRAPLRCTTGRSRGVRGQAAVETVVQLERSKNPIQKKQWIKVTATIKRATFTEKAVIETEVYYLPFMEAVEKAQARWPNIEKSYTTLPIALKEESEKKG